MKVLLSIKPEYVDKIISGEKKFEYRKRIFKEKVDTVVVYSTMPVGKIVGEFKIEEIINDTPDNIWSLTSHHSGVSEVFFMEYFDKCSEGFALKIKDIELYNTPIDPKKRKMHFTPPQSFMYVDNDFLTAF